MGRSIWIRGFNETNNLTWISYIEELKELKMMDE